MKYQQPISLQLNKIVLVINTICVCGAGTMGRGIAQVAAQAGFYTVLYELNKTALDNAKISLEKAVGLLAEKGKINDVEKQKILQRIQYTSDIQSCLADFFIEAIVEKPEAKIALFNQLAELNHSECIFASNTSSLSVSSIAGKIKNPERVIGMHFFNPAPLMKLVEVVTTDYTEKGITGITRELAKQMDKVPVVCKDSPGFIVNRVARPYYIESLRLAEEGHIRFEQLDQLLESTGFKMGPFKLMDLIGNDVNYAVSTSVYDQLHQPERLRPSSIQREKVEKGELGRKTGKGYYPYPLKGD
ncbi:MAG: 3-hydroxyacyl-CoA dehydrogenase NAD-binding domain-containing protein [Bacteroidota bacterium]|nr:3-hydroxyacyl-CoA dehydrogenase NAD-binding domain-containing protein [Bacteroidota bacterium]